MLAVAGVSHKTATIEIRERLALDAAELAELLPQLRAQFGPAVVLSTCNRTELYASGASAPSEALGMAAFLADRRGLALSANPSAFYTLTDGEAVRHLYRVAAGLESLVLGEAQILGQVRRALHTAERLGAADGLLLRLFQTAVSAGRRLRTGGEAAGSAASVSAAAVELACRRLGNLSDRTVLVVSTGEAGTLTARALRDHGARRIIVAGRTIARAETLAAELGVSAISLHALPTALAVADVVISATSARGFQLDRSGVQSALAPRPQQELLLIDLAVPRDIDPAVRGLPNVSLFDIDDLQPLVSAVQAVDESDGEWREAALDEEVHNFISWWQSRWVVPTISALRGHAESIRRGELSKTLGRLPNLSAEERRRIDALTSAIVNKLLHQPIMCLKESEDGSVYIDAVRELFALPAGPGAARPARDSGASKRGTALQ